MKLIVALGALIVGAGVALVLMMSRGDRDATATPPGAPTAPAARIAAPSAVADPAPALPAPTGSGGADGAGSGGVKEYVVGGVKVRDHRKGDNAPFDLPPNPHPADARALPPELTHDISQQIRRQMDACAAAVPKDARGAKPKLEGQVTVAIHDHKLTVTNLALQVRDVEGPGADALKQCVADKAASYVSSAPDQADLDSYGIAITFALP